MTRSKTFTRKQHVLSSLSKSRPGDRNVGCPCTVDYRSRSTHYQMAQALGGCQLCVSVLGHLLDMGYIEATRWTEPLMHGWGVLQRYTILGGILKIERRNTKMFARCWFTSSLGNTKLYKSLIFRLGSLPNHALGSTSWTWEASPLGRAFS